MIVSIISVGTEIVIGDILNTNAKYLAEELANLGLNVYRHISVGDNEKRLLNVIKEEYKEADILILTGGLGPTDDDITKEVVCKYFDIDLILDEKLNSFITNYDNTYNKRNDTFSKQALVPKDSIIIENTVGTAPGIIIEKNNKIAILMPGPPFEMKAIFKNEIKKYLKKFSNSKFYSKYIRFYGIGELKLEKKLESIMKNQTNPTFALYAKPGEVLLRITENLNEKQNHSLIDENIKKIENIAGKYIYEISETINSDSNLDNIVIDLLLKNKVKINIFEGITLGNFTRLLIKNNEIQKLFISSIICLHNDENEIENKFINENDTLNIAILGNENLDDNKPNTISNFKIFIKYNEISIKKEIQFNGVKNMLINRICLEALNEIRKILINK